MYNEQQSSFWINDLINIVAWECGVSQDTAKLRCQQLDRLRLLKYLASSLSGHKYRIIVYSKTDDEVSYVDNWLKVNRLIEDQFGDIVETELVSIRHSMTNSEESGLRDKQESDKRYENGFKEKVFDAEPLTDFKKDSVKFSIKTDQNKNSNFEGS